jgi:hypothetical protein
MMRNVNRAAVDRITNMDEAARDRMAAIYAAMPEALRAEAMRLCQDIHFRIRREGREACLDAGSIRTAALSMAVAAMQDTERYLRQKQQDGDPGAGEKLVRVRLLRFRAIRIKRRGRAGADREWLRLFFPSMQQLRREGLSFRDLAIWIRRHHHRRISPAYVHRIYRLLDERDAGRKKIAALVHAEEDPQDS